MLKKIILSLCLLTAFATFGIAQIIDTKQPDADSIVALLPTLEGEEKLDAYQRLHQIIKFTHTPEEVIANIHAYGKEAQRQDNIAQEARAKFWEIEMYFNKNMYTEMDKVMPSYLEFMHKNEQWQMYFYTYNLKVGRIIFQEDAALGIEEAQKMYDMAIRLKNKEAIAAALLNLGKGYNVLVRDAEATPTFEEALKMLDGNPRSDFRFSAYWYLSRQYATEGKTEKLLALIKQWEAEVNQMIAEGDSPHEHHDQYNEIYQGYAKVYAWNDEPQKALEYLELARPYGSLLGSGTNRQLWNLEANILYTMGRYDEVLVLLDSIYQSAVEDNQPHTVAMMLRQKARIYAMQGNAKQTEKFFEMYIDKKDSITGLNLESKLGEMRTKYEVDRHILEKARNKNYAIFAVIGLALALIALTLWIFYSRNLKIKNQLLIKRINEQDRLREQLQTCALERKALEPETKVDELFERITELVEKERAFVDPSLNRTSLAALVGSNETYVRRSIQSNTGLTVNEYLNNLRLRYARELLTNRKLTIEVVAAESGFGARNTFHNLFRKECGLTPDEFRRFSN
ncbi:AraC family transcriptional regulator [Bacteroides sp. 214]|uniref:helix-turn-helix transcriptional regulator n=1 Tax=Bacteroides sp. 214 TaxID=2302935 RepID=UPI0013D024A9|nr:helix-turn-helix transcriptional regulator [Bacteroides sp. 214]NDW12571.1 AraC family transcriptional regulator [Bacteroides sp. 214]